MRRHFPSILEDALSRGFDQSERIERDDYGRFSSRVRVRCSQCEALVINGMATHENRCPNIPREEVEAE